MDFPAPPVQTPFNIVNGAMPYPWLRWFQEVATALGYTAPAVTGSRGGNAALASLLTGLAGAGLIVNNSTP